jgi:hypothetical protein
MAGTGLQQVGKFYFFQLFNERKKYLSTQLVSVHPWQYLLREAKPNNYATRMKTTIKKCLI